MWGIIIAVIIYAIGILVIVGKEGIRETKSNTVWSEEELNKVKGASVMGWRLLSLILIVMGAVVLYYNQISAIPDQAELTSKTDVIAEIEKNNGTGDIKVVFAKDEKEYTLTNAMNRKLDVDQVIALKEKEVTIYYEEKSNPFSKNTIHSIYELTSEGTTYLSYGTAKGNSDKLSSVWKQLAMFFFTAAGITILILLYAHINPKVYKIICIYKPEKGIKPTVGQRLEQEIGGIWEHNFKSKITTSTGEKMQEKMTENISNNVSNDVESDIIIVEMDQNTYREYLLFLEYREKLKQNI